MITGVSLTASSPLWEVVGGIQYLASIHCEPMDLGQEGQEDQLDIFSGTLGLGQGHSKVVHTISMLLPSYYSPTSLR